MRGPICGATGRIDDERMRDAIARVRAVAFAIVSGVAGPALVLSFGDEDRSGTQAVGARYVAVLGIATVGTAALAAWAAWGRRDIVIGTFLRPSLAGAANATLGVTTVLTWIALEGGLHLEHGAPAIYALALGAAMTVGWILGFLFGLALLPLWGALDEVAAVPRITTMPRALGIAATWSAVVLSLVAGLTRTMPLVGAIAGVLAGCAGALAIVSWLEAVRRRAFARRVARGGVEGWRDERDEDGTRWLVREQRSGEGVYREGVVSRRWARA